MMQAVIFSRGEWLFDPTESRPLPRVECSPAELNHKSIHLSFGQRVSSVRLHGVLCGNYEEQFRERITCARLH